MAVTPVRTVLGDTELANWALDLLGGGQDATQTIGSIDDTTATAIICKRNLNIAKELAFNDLFPAATIQYINGADAGSDFTDTSGIEHVEYDYAYPVPADCILFLGLVDVDHGAVQYEYANGYIHTNEEPADLYIQGIFAPDPVALNANVSQCIAYKLAMQMCGPIVASSEADGKRQALLTEYERFILPRARGINAAQEYDTINEAARSGRIIDIT